MYRYIYVDDCNKIMIHLETCIDVYTFDDFSSLLFMLIFFVIALRTCIYVCINYCDIHAHTFMLIVSIHVSVSMFFACVVVSVSVSVCTFLFLHVFACVPIPRNMYTCTHLVSHVFSKS